MRKIKLYALCILTSFVMILSLFACQKEETPAPVQEPIAEKTQEEILQEYQEQVYKTQLSDYALRKDKEDRVIVAQVMYNLNIKTLYYYDVELIGRNPETYFVKVNSTFCMLEITRDDFGEIIDVKYKL